ncbi:hypothetical protein QTO34_002180 [Cnephaeus nilssonii]|uniref:Uncharacterized protein n=1 Tax=Cnephaeus nilssonii TaxID=3371016 RepID=A0AA40HU87_CNENI|nr:hypothetical protein QTO34_002180 [Eptesicus nilssonii]
MRVVFRSPWSSSWLSVTCSTAPASGLHLLPWSSPRAVAVRSPGVCPGRRVGGPVLSASGSSPDGTPQACGAAHTPGSHDLAWRKRPLLPDFPGAGMGKRTATSVHPTAVVTVLTHVSPPGADLHRARSCNPVYPSHAFPDSQQPDASTGLTLSVPPQASRAQADTVCRTDGHHIWEMEAKTDRDLCKPTHISRKHLPWVSIASYLDRCPWLHPGVSARSLTLRELAGGRDTAVSQPEITSPVPVSFYVCNGKRKRSQYQPFTYLPANGSPTCTAIQCCSLTPTELKAALGPNSYDPTLYVCPRSCITTLYISQVLHHHALSLPQVLHHHVYIYPRSSITTLSSTPGPPSPHSPSPRSSITTLYIYPRSSITTLSIYPRSSITTSPLPRVLITTLYIYPRSSITTL